jgi:hypothetical protein
MNTTFIRHRDWDEEDDRQLPVWFTPDSGLPMHNGRPLYFRTAAQSSISGAAERIESLFQSYHESNR